MAKSAKRTHRTERGEPADLPSKVKAEVCSATYSLVNGSTGDPMLFVDYPGRNDAFLFDAGDNSRLDDKRLSDLRWLFITHFHIDHFVGLDRILRANLDGDKTLTLIGPTGAIERVYRRLTSYDHPWFPFQKLVLRVQEVCGSKIREADLRFEDRLPAPTVVERDWLGPIVYEDHNLIVETVEVDHSVPCLAFAIVEKPGWAPVFQKRKAPTLRPGPWVGQVLTRLRAGDEKDGVIRIADTEHRLADLARHYFRNSTGVRIAYVTDTHWSEKVKPSLIRLAKGARRLYCDSSYLAKDRDKADQYKHMTAADAAELARDAGAYELVPMHYSRRYAGEYQLLCEEARAVFDKVEPEMLGD